MTEAEDLEIKELRLELLDLVFEYTDESVRYFPYMCKYEEELRALVGLPVQEQRKRLKVIAHKVIT